MRTPDQAIEWMKTQVAKKTKGWDHRCQSSVRQAFNLGAWAPSAKAAWLATPQKYRHHTKVADVPPGMPCYGLFHTQWGHVWLSGHHGVGYSVDYRVRGQISAVPLDMAAWTHTPGMVYWANWVNGHVLPIPHK
jgi:hypothetical protein